MSSSAFLMQYANSNVVNELGTTFAAAASSYGRGGSKPIPARRLSTRASRDAVINDANLEIARLTGFIAHLSGNTTATTSVVTRTIRRLQECDTKLHAMSQQVSYDEIEVRRLNAILARIRAALQVTASVSFDQLVAYVHQQIHDLETLKTAKRNLDATDANYKQSYQELQLTFDKTVAQWTKSKADLHSLTIKHSDLSSDFAALQSSSDASVLLLQEANLTMKNERDQIANVIADCQDPGEVTSLQNQLNALKAAHHNMHSKNETLQSALQNMTQKCNNLSPVTT